MTRKRWIAVIAVVVLVAIAGVGYYFLFGQGAATLNRWIGDKLVAVAADYLNPRLTFKSFQYHYPLTAILEDVQLTIDDPATPGATVTIFAARRLALDMAEIPRSDQPLRIQKLTLEGPEICLISATGTQGPILGFSNLLKEQPGQAGLPPTPLSSVFEIRLIEVRDLAVVYDTRKSGVKPMTLDHITTTLKVEPAAAQSGWYAMALDLDRKPVFTTHVAGHFNLDSMLLEAKEFKLALKVGRAQDSLLPPEIQEVLKAHDVTGDLAVAASGTVPLTNLPALKLETTLTLKGGNVAAGDHHIPIEKLDVRCHAADGVLHLEALNVGTLGGRVEAQGQFGLTGDKPAHVELAVAGVRLEQALRNPSGADSEFRGAVDGRVMWDAPPATAMTASRGNGTVRITEGHLAALPVLGDVLDGLSKAMAVAHLGSGPPTDTADGVFTFEGDRVNFSRLDLVTAWAVARGAGDVYFDGKLDLTLNAGPLEKIESILGKPGDLVGKAGGALGKDGALGAAGSVVGEAGKALSSIGKFVGKTAGSVTDQVMAYAVTGTVDDVKVGVKVAPGLHLP
jgi:AsmA-like C-terminal region